MLHEQIKLISAKEWKNAFLLECDNNVTRIPITAGISISLLFGYFEKSEFLHKS